MNGDWLVVLYGLMVMAYFALIAWMLRDRGREERKMLIEVLEKVEKQEKEENAQRIRKRSPRSSGDSGKRVSRSRSISRKSGNRVREGFE